MTTSFSSLPIVDLSVLSSTTPSTPDLLNLSKQLHDVFATTGFAYLVNAPLKSSHDEVFGLAREFFTLDSATKMSLAKQSFVPSNQNTYRGYFPPQSGQQDNLKEGFEVGPSSPKPRTQKETANHAVQQKFQLAESNVWPNEQAFQNGRERMEKLHAELQALSCTLLSLLAVSLNRDPDFFAPYLVDSLSTLRLLHYPPQPTRFTSSASDNSCDADNNGGELRLCCTPHTDSGILTLLHQDPTGGLEVRNAAGEWVAAPYLPGSLVVNIGDLLADVSGGRFVATMHRVRASSGQKIDEIASARGDGDSKGAMGRLSVPFFFEPGEQCVVRAVDGGDGVVYGAHVRRKMGTWVEFQDCKEDEVDWKNDNVAHGSADVAVAA